MKAPVALGNGAFVFLAAHLLDLQLSDTVRAMKLHPDGTYRGSSEATARPRRPTRSSPGCFRT